MSAKRRFSHYNKRPKSQNHILRSKRRIDQFRPEKLLSRREKSKFYIPLNKTFKDLKSEKFVVRNPLPMKFRALPQSFWQQPNKSPDIPPVSAFTDVFTLNKDEETFTSDIKDHEDLTEVVSDANTDLLFSLFKAVEEEQEKSEGKCKIKRNKRGRSRKPRQCPKVIRDDDPYLASSVTENFLTLLPARNRLETLRQSGRQVLRKNTKAADSSMLLGSGGIGTNSNFSNILSQLVVQL